MKTHAKVETWKQSRHSQRISSLYQESFYKQCNLHAEKVPTNQQVFNVSIRAWTNSNGTFRFVRLFEKISWFFFQPFLRVQKRTIITSFALQENDVPVQLDLWWAKIFQASNYPVLSQVVKACLAIFSGPHVESSRSLMSNIIDKRSNRMNIDTYNAMMTIKYSLQAKSSSEIYRLRMFYMVPLTKKCATMSALHI